MNEVGKRLLRHAAWYLLAVRWDIREPWDKHREEIGESVDLLFGLAK